MPNANKTLIAVVLDRSGSMATVREATIAGLNTFLDGQRALPGEVILHLVQFDDQYEIPRNMVNLKDSPNLTQLDFLPRGWTALLDAVGKTVVDVGNRLAATPEAERPGKVIFVVQTDGHENASREFSYSRIQDMIKHQREKYAWEFVFLGANQDAIAGGAAIGIQAASSLSYNATAGSTLNTFNALTRSVGNYRTGQAVNSTFDLADRAAAASDVAIDPTAATATPPADPNAKP